MVSFLGILGMKNQIALLFCLKVQLFSLYIVFIIAKNNYAIYQDKSNCPVKMVIFDFRLIVVQYDLVDFIFTRLSLS